MTTGDHVYRPRKIVRIQPRVETKYRDVQPILARELKASRNRKQRVLLLAQLRAHRRYAKYAIVVRNYGPQKGVSMPWSESKRTKAWKLVRQASKLVKKLRRIQ